MQPGALATGALDVGACSVAKAPGDLKQHSKYPGKAASKSK